MTNPLSPVKSSKVYPSVELVKAVCPDSPIKNITQNLPFILAAMAKAGLTSRNQLIAMLATIYTEVRSFKPIREIGRGGGAYGVFYGRGYLQLTWKKNYQRYFETTGVDIVSNPDLALEAEQAANILIWYWQGKAGNPSIVPYAEKGDWHNVRSIVNGGVTGISPSKLFGLKTFNGAIARGEQFLSAGAIASDVAQLPGTYGIGCADGFPHRVYTDTHNPNSTGDAIAAALGLAQSQAWKKCEFQGTFNVAANPELLKIRSQKKFELAGLGEKLNGEYLIEEALLIKNKTLELVTTAYQKDPLAPDPIVFRQDADSPLVNPVVYATATDISGAVWAAAKSNVGKSTKDAPAGGRLGCAFAVGKFAVLPAGLAKLGSGPFGSNAVAGVLEALRGGRGVKISQNQAIPGDLWLDSDGRHHIGVVYEADSQGASRILSNSSSKASFSWIGTIANYESFYPSKSSQYWRLVS